MDGIDMIGWIANMTQLGNMVEISDQMLKGYSSVRQLNIDLCIGKLHDIRSRLDRLISFLVWLLK
jgi:hypothetical protein